MIEYKLRSLAGSDDMPIKNPPFQITNTMIDLVAEIAELMGRLTVTNQLSSNPVLRRNNRIRTIHGSLAFLVVV